MAARLRWAVDIVAASVPRTVLEIGSGPGVAIELLGDRRFYWFYEPPSRAQAAKAKIACHEQLKEHGFTVGETLLTELDGHVRLSLIPS